VSADWAAVLSFADVVAAADRLAGTVERTPVLTSRALDVAVGAGAELFLKAECRQVTGSFKFRGASNAIRQLTGEQLRRGVITYSSGNHAQAVAKAARMVGTDAVVVMPHDAPQQKVAATEAEGARIVRYDRYCEDRVAVAGTIAKAEGRVVIPPYDHPAVMAGQGTVGLELVEEVPDLDAIYVPVGGGGLLAGIATAIDPIRPEAEIYGVEPETGDDHRRSRRAGRRVAIDVPVTIADGQQITAPGELTWPITSRLATAFVTVTDDEIVAAMRLLYDHLDLVVEPSGASAMAAVHNRAVRDGGADLSGQRIGVVVSGGNIDRARHRELIGAG